MKNPALPVPVRPRAHRRAACPRPALVAAVVLACTGPAEAAMYADFVPGSVGVSRTGAMTYSIPIEVPPGVAQMQPALTLSYDSQAGNGPLGLGWALSGLSAVHRCPKTIATDGSDGGVNLDAMDRFCLDGKRLINVSGAYGASGSGYRTEVESFTRVVSHGGGEDGPTKFTAWTRDGRKLHYGHTAGARVEAPLSGGRAFVWHLDRITDTSGNYLTVRYDEERGESLPVRIDYTGNGGVAPRASVRFEYESRPDRHPTYLGGSRIARERRLAGIHTYVGSTPVRRYELGYRTQPITGISLLDRVRICDGENTCLPGSGFTWARNLAAGLDTARYGRPRGTGNYAPYTRHAGDFDGDGLTDLAFTYQGPNGTVVHAAHSRGAGKFVMRYSKPSTRDSRGYEAHPGDFNGDGITDLLWLRRAPGKGIHARMAMGRSAGGFRASIYHPVRTTGDFSAHAVHIADLNGDGRSDLALTRAVAGDGVRVHRALSLGGGKFGYLAPSSPRRTGNFTAFDAVVADANGDGRGDLIWTRGSASGIRVLTALASPTGRFPSASYDAPHRTGNFTAYEPRVLDVNADGNQDLVWTRGTDTGLRTYVSIAKGNGRYANAVYSRPSATGSFASARVVPGDFNRDGLGDLAWTMQGDFGLRAYIAIGLGNGKFAGVRRSMPRTSGSFGRFTPTAGDFDGDGATDISWIFQMTSSGLRTYTAHARADRNQGTIVAITPGRGAEIDIEYRRLTEAGSYTPGSKAMYPMVDIRPPMPVVTALRRTAPGTVEHTSYVYRGLKADLHGRGLLGFSSMTTTNENSGVATHTAYRLAFPYTGQDLSSRVELANGRLLSSKSTFWTHRTAYSGRVFVPQVVRSVSGQYEPNAPHGDSMISKVVSTPQYDGYGNVVRNVTRTTGAGKTFTQETTTRYRNDTDRWLLGLILERRLRRVAPDGSAQQRTTRFTRSLVTGLVSEEIAEPGTPLELRTTVTRNRFGLWTSRTLSGNGVASRTTRQSFDPSGRFAIAAVNALGHTERRDYDERFGAVTRLTGPNGLVTAWSFDGLGRLRSESRANGTRTTKVRALCRDDLWMCPRGAALAVRTQVTGGADVTRYFDGFGRERRTETESHDGRAILVDVEYDAQGRVERRSRARFAGEAIRWTIFSHDAAGRVVAETAPDGSVVRTRHHRDPVTRQSVTTVTDPLGRTHVTMRDALGRTEQVVDPAGGVLRHHYDAFDNLIRTRDPAGNVVTMTYDRLGRKIAMSDPDMGRWTYEYDVLGQLVGQRDARGEVFTFAHDRLGRLVERHEREGTTRWTYDTAQHGIGKLHRVTAPNGYLEEHEYDSLSRPVASRRTIMMETYTTRRSYDDKGRPARFTYPATATDPRGLRVESVYTANGYLRAVRNADRPATVYWRAAERDADSTPVRIVLGNGVVTERGFDPGTGRLAYIQSGDGLRANVQDAGYVFDRVGNLTVRESFLESVYETFEYDALNRLERTRLYDAASDAVAEHTTYTYDAVGNIATRSDVGTYSYGAGAAGPHAVTRAGDKTYHYDANGNVVAAGDRLVDWSSFNKPIAIDDGVNRSTFAYGPDRKRIQQGHADALSTRTTKYVGERFEQVTSPGEPTEYRHHIMVGGTRVAIHTTRSDASSKTRYLHTDHLGSTVAVTDEAGTVVERLSFGPHGKRRESNWEAPLTAIAGIETNRGFTGHEHLDHLGLVHMNGRVYDPEIGRFLSADPHIQDPLNAQSYNRYTYVLNNPLSLTDPSGYFSIGDIFSAVADAVTTVFENKAVRIIAASAIAIALPQLISPMLGGLTAMQGAIVSRAAGGFLAGLAGSAGDLESAIISGASAGAFAFIGASSTLGYPLHDPTGGRIVAHGLVGGISSHARGGSFVAGFTSGAVSKSFSGAIASVGDDNIVLGLAGTATLGGLTSTIAGGRFEDGAISAGFGYLYNQAGASRGKNDSPNLGKHMTRGRSGHPQTIEGAGLEAAFGPSHNTGGSKYAATLAGDASASVFVGLLGVDLSVGGRVDTKGTFCTVSTTCIQLGLGGFFGVGAKGGAAAGKPLAPGTYWTHGLFFNAGGAAAVGRSAEISGEGIGGAKVFLGGGQGLAGGYQYCRVIVHKCS